MAHRYTIRIKCDDQDEPLLVEFSCQNYEEMELKFSQVLGWFREHETHLDQAGEAKPKETEKKSAR